MGSTNKELVQILEARNNEGRYDKLIADAKADLFHDFKSMYATPKMQLAEELLKFPELDDVREMVKKGDFDE